MLFINNDNVATIAIVIGKDNSKHALFVIFCAIG